MPVPLPQPQDQLNRQSPHLILLRTIFPTHLPALFYSSSYHHHIPVSGSSKAIAPLMSFTPHPSFTTVKPVPESRLDDHQFRLCKVYQYHVIFFMKMLRAAALPRSLPWQQPRHDKDPAYHKHLRLHLRFKSAVSGILLHTNFYLACAVFASLFAEADSNLTGTLFLNLASVLSLEDIYISPALNQFCISFL